MENKIKLFGIITLAAIISFLTIGCPKEDEPEDKPTVTSVTINPATGSVTKGGNRYFYAKVNGTNNPAQTVTWSIVETNKNANTTINNASGLLTVATAETLASLTVNATSTADTTKSATIPVTVTEWVFNGFEGETLTGSSSEQVTRKINGYDFELWNQNKQGTTSMKLGEGGTFNCSWNGVQNVLFRAGKKLGSTQTHSQIGDISIEYNVSSYTFTGSVSYLSVYGWVTGGSPDKLIEYYIVEKLGSYNPGADNGVYKGTVTVDGGTYSIYEKQMTNKPSIQGNTNFKQYWSIRSSGRTSGTISVSQHFNAWADKGLVSINNGKMYEVALKVEGYQNNGSAEIHKNILSINGVPIK